MGLGFSAGGGGAEGTPSIELHLMEGISREMLCRLSHEDDSTQQRETESTCTYFKLDLTCLVSSSRLCFALSQRFKLMSGQFGRGSCAQNSQAHLPHPAGLTVGSSPLSGSDDAKPPAELGGAALRPRPSGDPPGRRKPGAARRAVLPRPLPRAFLCCLSQWATWTCLRFARVWLGMSARGQS